MGSAYHWEARRQQMALERRKTLIAQQQEQEAKKQEEKKQRFEKTCQPHQDSKGPQQNSKGPQQDSKGPQKDSKGPHKDSKGPPPTQPQQQAQPQPPRPKSQKEQDPPMKSIKDSLQKDTQKQGPQTRPAGAQQVGQQSYEVCDKPLILPGRGGRTNACQSSSSKDSRLTSTNYVQQW